MAGEQRKQVIADLSKSICVQVHQEKSMGLWIFVSELHKRLYTFNLKVHLGYLPYSALKTEQNSLVNEGKGSNIVRHKRQTEASPTSISI